MRTQDPHDQTLQHLQAFIAEHGYSPTIAELAKAAGINPNAIAGRLKALEAQGRIKRTPRVARSIRPA